MPPVAPKLGNDPVVASSFPDHSSSISYSDFVEIVYQISDTKGSVFVKRGLNEPSPKTFEVQITPDDVENDMIKGRLLLLSRFLVNWFMLFGLGVVQGLQLMTVGDRYLFYIPWFLAYGPYGTPGDEIAPYSTAVFEIELKAINKPKKDL